MKDELEGKLKNRVALITGASRGVGRAIAERLSVYSMKIGLLARSEEKLRELEEIVNASGSEAMVLCRDLRNRKDIEDAAHLFTEKYGIPDFLINNAGIGSRGFWQDVPLEKELEMMRVNFTAPVILIRLILPEMFKADKGHIININSTAGIYNAPYEGGYSASKFALLAYTTSLAYELEKTNIRISSILPGPIDTDFLNSPNFDVFKKRKDIVSAYEVADKVLSVIGHPRERVFIGGAWKELAIKIVSLNPRFFAKIIKPKDPGKT